MTRLGAYSRAVLEIHTYVPHGAIAWPLRSGMVPEWANTDNPGQEARQRAWHVLPLACGRHSRVPDQAMTAVNHISQPFRWVHRSGSDTDVAGSYRTGSKFCTVYPSRAMMKYAKPSFSVQAHSHHQSILPPSHTRHPTPQTGHEHARTHTPHHTTPRPPCRNHTRLHQIGWRHDFMSDAVADAVAVCSAPCIRPAI